MATSKSSTPVQHEQHSVEALEIAIGKQVRSSRKRLNLTVAALAKQARLSTGMLSKIENGQTSPSLATLTSLAKALQVPVTSFFRGYEEQRDVTYTRAGEGLAIERRGSGVGPDLVLRPTRNDFRGGRRARRVAALAALSRPA